MNNEISIWNGYPVHGDIKELDRINKSDGLINLDKDDVANVLSAEGESHVTSGATPNLAKLLTKPSTPCLVRLIRWMNY